MFSRGGQSRLALPWLWPVIAAPFVGSFLTVLVLRLKTGASIVWGRSACRSCGTSLSPPDLVPLVSWALSGGRCRYCGTGIGLFYPAMELAALGVALWAAILPDGGPRPLWVSCLLGWLLLAIAASDMRRALVPDGLALSLLAAGLVEGAALAPDALDGRMLGAVAGYAAAVAIRRALHGKDKAGVEGAKLLAAAGGWVSWTGLPAVMLIAVAAMLGTVAIRKASGRMPFAAFICLGTWIVWLYGGTLH